MSYVYQPKSTQQLKNTFNSKSSAGVNGFENFEDFKNWYQSQELHCHYCGLTEMEMQEITMNGLLTSKRFPDNGVIGQGKNRAVWLEIDRIDSNGLYSRHNCVLSCYFCNNDKSDVFPGSEYVKFFQNRPQYLRQLLANYRKVK